MSRFLVVLLDLEAEESLQAQRRIEPMHERTERESSIQPTARLVKGFSRMLLPRSKIAGNRNDVDCGVARVGTSRS